MATEVGGGPVGLVLAGGGARGAYEVGALSVLLPRLGDEHRPTVLVGNSVGAINTAYLGSTADQEIGPAINGGLTEWRQLRIASVIRHLVSLGMTGRSLQYVGEVIGWPGARLWSLLDASPRATTIEKIVRFDKLNKNVDDRTLVAVAVVATSALTRRSVVFHHGGGHPKFDARRRIQYVATPLGPQHVLASSAIPAVFSAVHVDDPEDAAGWYVDGGTRLNTPIKPALQLGAKRVVVIGLASLADAETRIAGDARPDALAGIGQLVYALLADRLTQDVHTLAHFNDAVKAGAAGDVVPYIFVAPDDPGKVEQLAFKVFCDRYRRPWRLLRRPDLGLIGRFTGAGVTTENATLFSMLAFDPSFIEGMIEMGQQDAERWLAAPHDAGLWQTGPL